MIFLYRFEWVFFYMIISLYDHFKILIHYFLIKLSPGYVSEDSLQSLNSHYFRHQDLGTFPLYIKSLIFFFTDPARTITQIRLPEIIIEIYNAQNTHYWTQGLTGDLRFEHPAVNFFLCDPYPKTGSSLSDQLEP